MTPELPDDLITPHFRRDELWCPCGCGMLPFRGAVLELEHARSVLGDVPVFVNSAARCPDYNATLRFCPDCDMSVRKWECPRCGRPTRQRSAVNSMHTYGKAFDIVAKGWKPSDVFRAVRAQVKAFRLGGMGLYRTFVHLDTGPGPRQWTG